MCLLTPSGVPEHMEASLAAGSAAVQAKRPADWHKQLLIMDKQKGKREYKNTTLSARRPVCPDPLTALEAVWTRLGFVPSQCCSPLAIWDTESAVFDALLICFDWTHPDGLSNCIGNPLSPLFSA